MVYPEDRGGPPVMVVCYDDRFDAEDREAALQVSLDSPAPISTLIALGGLTYGCSPAFQERWRTRVLGAEPSTPEDCLGLGRHFHGRGNEERARELLERGYIHAYAMSKERGFADQENAKELASELGLDLRPEQISGPALQRAGFIDLAQCTFPLETTLTKSRSIALFHMDPEEGPHIWLVSLEPNGSLVKRVRSASGFSSESRSVSSSDFLPLNSSAMAPLTLNMHEEEDGYAVTIDKPAPTEYRP